MATEDSQTRRSPSGGAGIRVSFGISRRMIFIASTLLAAMAALSIAALHGAGGTPEAAAQGQSKHWAMTIPGGPPQRENFWSGQRSELVPIKFVILWITNPNGVQVKVGVVRYPAIRGDRGDATCNPLLRPYSATTCEFRLSEALSRGPVAMVVAAPIAIAVTAEVHWRYRRKERFTIYDDLVIPVQVHEVR